MTQREPVFILAVPHHPSHPHQRCSYIQPHLALSSRRPSPLTEFGLASAQGHDHTPFTPQPSAQMMWILHLQKAKDELKKQP